MPARAACAAGATIDKNGEDFVRVVNERNEANKRVAYLRTTMDCVRDTARNRNPAGATILDFMVVWNEQYESQIAKLTYALAEARAACAEMREYVEGPIVYVTDTEIAARQVQRDGLLAAVERK